MKMKLVVILAALSAALHGTTQTVGTNADALAAFAEEWRCVVSEPRSNLAAVVFGNVGPGQAVLSPEAPINFGFLATNGVVYSFCLLRPEYGYRISALSLGGQPVSKTKTGLKYGRKFDEVRGYDRSTFDTVRHGLSGSPDMPYYGHSGLPNLVPPKRFPASLGDLFEFDKPGKYTVSLEVQIVAWPLRSSPTNASIVRFPPMRLDVVKE